MNPEWKKFLTDRGAQFKNNKICHFIDPLPEIDWVLNESVLADQSQDCYIEVTGEDAQTFIQGQFSNDITHVNETTTQLSSYSTPKGRMLAIFRIFTFENKYYLLTSQELKESLIKRLTMFVMMSKVTFKDVSDEMVSFSIAGKLINKLINTPSENNSITYYDGFCNFKVGNRIQYFGHYKALSNQWKMLSDKGFKPVGENAWHISTLKNGIPAIYLSSSESFIPQHTNLDSLSAINFKKGCYTGQEIIARLHYLGKQKKKMYLCSVTTDLEPVINSPLYKKGEKSKQGTGNIVDIASLDNNKYLMLAVIQNNAIKDDVFVHSESGDKITIEELPYSI